MRSIYFFLSVLTQAPFPAARVALVRLENLIFHIALIKIYFIIEKGIPRHSADGSFTNVHRELSILSPPWFFYIRAQWLG